MASEDFTHRNTASRNVYFRLFETSTGNVFDFNDNTFKALAGATTPSVAATERGDMDGTGYSVYVANINLSNVHNEGVAKYIIAKAYDNAAPADADISISDDIGIYVQFGELKKKTVVAVGSVSVKSTAGTTAQVRCWLERDGKKVKGLSTIDAAISAIVVVREHGSGSNLFSKALVVGDLQNDTFEAEQASPGFVDDRMYDIESTITENTNPHDGSDTIVVIG